MAKSKILIFVPLKEEFDGIIQLLDERKAKCASTPNGDRPTLHYTLDPDTRRERHILLYAMDPDNRQAMGNIMSCARVSSALINHRPRMVLLVGIAGSLDASEVRLGDVVISDTAKYLHPDKLTPINNGQFHVEDDCYDSTDASVDSSKIVIHRIKTVGSGNALRIRRDYVRCDASSVFLQDYKSSLRNNTVAGLESTKLICEAIDEIDDVGAVSRDVPIVKMGDILGSEWVVDCPDYIKFVKNRNASTDWDWYSQNDRLKNTKEAEKRNRWQPDPILAVDMESYGFLKAVDGYNRWGYEGRQSVTQAIALRGICDLAADKGRLDGISSGEIRHIAVRNAMRTALDIIDHLPLSD